MMKRKLTPALLSLISLLSCVALANNVPPLMSYQGFLTEPDGSAVGATAPVNRKAIFSLFDHSDEGKRVWTEQQVITISKGEFSVQLGSGVAVGTEARDTLNKVFAANGGNLYLEVTVDTGNGSLSLSNPAEDPPLKPRQRLVTAAYAFRAQSADGITLGQDLRFLAAGAAGAENQGLGYYDGTRAFGTSGVTGPVLYGQNGGVLGSANGTTQNIALSWSSSGNIGIGTTAPTERLHVIGNVKSTGTITTIGNASLAGALSTTGALEVGSLSTTGEIRGTALTATDLSIRPAPTVANPTPTPVAGFNSDGALSITSGGTLQGPVGKPLNIHSQGSITIKDIEVTGSVNLPPSGAASAVPVLETQRRLVIGGGQGWGDAVAATQAAPLEGVDANGNSLATGMRLILGGTNAASDVVGFGLQPTNALFGIVPTTGEFQWYAGTEKIMSLTGSSTNSTLGTSSIRSADGAENRLKITGKNYSRLQLTQTRTTKADTRDLALTLNPNSTANLAWIADDGESLVPILNFLHTGGDPQLAGGTSILSAADATANPTSSSTNNISNMGYVGINVTRPRAPLHVKQIADYQNNTDTIFFIGGSAADRPNYGVYFGPDGGLADFNTADANWGNNSTLRYESITALFDGETVAGRNFFGQQLNASSDIRAKKVLGRSDTQTDLNLLMQLEVTNYHWIDRTIDLHRPHKRLIAQQVKAVFPQAVSTSPQVQAIPSVYEEASQLKHDPAAGMLTITTRKEHGFKVGDKVDLYGEKQEMKEIEVQAVLNAHTFTVACVEPQKSIFVYGKRVHDFNTVDYDAVSMLNVSATQELKKRRDQLAQRNAQLRAQLKSESSKLQKLRKEQQEDEARYMAAEAMLESMEKSASRPRFKTQTASVKTR